MAVLNYPITIEQGATYSKTFTWKDSSGVAKPLTDCTLRMMIRRDFEDAAPLLSLTSNPPAGLSIVGAPANGQFRIDITAVQTAAMVFSEAKYDLEVQDAVGTVVRLLEGTITLSREVTKP